MTRSLILALGLAAMPLMAAAMPVIGDVVGTDAEAARAALETAGCTGAEFEIEDGKIEAKCTDTATGAMMEVYIDPANGTVVEIKAED